MARAHTKRHPGVSSHHGPEQHPGASDEVTQLCNRITLLTFGAAFAFVLGLVVTSAAVAAGGPGLALVPASLPLLAAAGAALRIRRLRSELRAKRALRAAQAPATPAEPAPERPRTSAPRAPLAGRAQG